MVRTVAHSCGGLTDRFYSRRRHDVDQFGEDGGFELANRALILLVLGELVHGECGIEARFVVRRVQALSDGKEILSSHHDVVVLRTHAEVAKRQNGVPTGFLIVSILLDEVTVTLGAWRNWLLRVVRHGLTERVEDKHCARLRTGKITELDVHLLSHQIRVIFWVGGQVHKAQSREASGHSIIVHSTLLQSLDASATEHRRMRVVVRR